jgi:hypothetical protein
MAKFARLDGANTVIELFEHATLLPSATHIAAIAAQFVPCPDTVVVGAVKSGATWTNPAAVTPPTPPLPLLTPMTLYLAFTPAERIAIKASTDAMVKEFWATYQLSVQLEKPTDPNLVSVQSMLAYLAAPVSPGPGAGILASPDRIAQILAGIPQ